MLDTQDVATTLRMIGEEHLDVRAVTLGINLNRCASSNARLMAQAVYDRICQKAARQVAACEEVSARYGVAIVNKRLAVSPASILLEGHSADTAVALADAMDRAAAAVGIDLIGGFTATALWEIVRHILVWYFTTLSKASIVYGSFATAVIMLLSMEVAAALLLLGAQVIAEYERIGRNQ